MLGYYVYALVDPTVTPPEVFYVGKGKGPRAFAHEYGVAGVRDDDKPALKKPKYERIRKIHDAGGQVKHIFLRTGMDEETAFAVEQAVIDVFNVGSLPLTNLVGGHDSSVADVDQLRARYSHPCPPLPKGTVLIKIARWHPNMTPELVYDQTRQWWRIAKWRCPRITTAFGLVEGVIRSAYTVNPDSWEETVDADGRIRRSFKGDFTPDLEPFLLTHVRDVINVSSQNPIRYPN